MSGVVPGEYYALGKLQGYLSAYDLAVSMYSGDSSLSAQALEIALWRQWKTTRRRRAALLQLGVRPQLATNTAGSGRGPWYLARAKALSVGLSNAYFRSLGLPSLFENC
jgi:hypothetical protein